MTSAKDSSLNENYPRIIASVPPTVAFTPPTRDDLLAMPAFRADALTGRNPTELYFKYVDEQSISGIVSYISDLAKQPILFPLMAQRIFNAECTRFGCALLHNATSTDVELILILRSGMLTRTLVRGLASWVFDVLRFSRVTLRIRSSEETLQHYARRAGFKFEGKQSGWYPDGTDCSLWAMSASCCPWRSPLTTGGVHG